VSLEKIINLEVTLIAIPFFFLAILLEILAIKFLKTNGTIDFINGTKTYLNNSIHNHKPKTGDMIIFPNNLMHTAYPFNVDGERRSFSFNLDLDIKTKKILNG